MADPEAAMLAFLQGIAAQLPTGTTYSNAFPSSAITAPHIQFNWDGTPSDADNREDTAVRFTVWVPKGKWPTGGGQLANSIAGTIRALALAYSGAGVFRVDRGAGRLPGVDNDTKLPFCTFTVNPVMHALTA